jgi:enamine deaminase RidA (YjgF/YER057c/UK114 family)
MIERHITNSRLSRVVVHRGVAYIAGTTPDTATASPRQQTQEVLGKIEDFLKQAQTDKSKLLAATVWVKDLNTLGEINEVWDNWIPQGCAPARACVEGTPARADFALEIAVTAAVGE